MRATLSKEGQLCGFLDGTLVSHPEQHTVAFLKPIKIENYPGLKDLRLHQISPEVGEVLLSFGHSILKKETLIAGINS